jgi:hypothetical protein
MPTGRYEERDYFKNLGIDGMIKLKYVFKKWGGGCMDRITLIQDRDRWQAFVNAVMNLPVP